MGQKVNPIGFRIGVTKKHLTNWYASTKDMPAMLTEDRVIRDYLFNRLANASVSKIEIQKTKSVVEVSIFTARPGIVIGRKGSEVEKLKSELQQVIGKKNVKLNIVEVKVPEIDATLVGRNIAAMIEKRMPFRRVMKKTVYNTMRMGAKGIKIRLAGRLGGAEMARQEIISEGKVPLQTLRSDIDYALVLAKTIWGVIGVKVWIYKGEVKKNFNAPKSAK